MSEEVLTTISPTTNEPICTRPGTTEAIVSNLPTLSTTAFESWRHTTLAHRQNIVRKALDLLLERKAVLAVGLTEQMGRPAAYAESEITTAVKRGEYLLRVSDECLSDTPGEAEEGFKRYIRKCAVGPVLVLFAWNYPYLILVNALVPALLAGNTVMMKPSPQTPGVADHVEEVFRLAGLPENVLIAFHTGAWTKVDGLIKNPDVKLICFTGSVEGGLKVLQAAAGRVVPVTLELGGKDPAYVREDVDLAWAAENIVDGAIFNSGQSCCSIERVYVAQAIYGPFWREVVRVLQGYRLGDPKSVDTQVGPVVSVRSKEAIERQIRDALAAGAKDVTPVNESFDSPPPKGNYIKPTVLIDVSHDMALMKQETFGPVIPIMPVRDDAHAIELMNDSDFGLTASVWTKDMSKGESLIDQIEAGTCFVNRCDFPSPDLAWTGWKDSGRGVTLGKFGFEQFVKLKSYHVRAV